MQIDLGITSSKNIQKTILNLIVQFLIASICYYVMSSIIITSSFYFNTYSATLSKGRIEQLIKLTKKYQWLVYIITPVVSLIKLFIVTVVLYIGCFFSEHKVQFKRLFSIVVIGEYVFSLSLILNTVFLYFKASSANTLAYIQSFQSFSLINFFSYKLIPQWAIYPVKTINIFEVIYVLLLGYLLAKEYKLKFMKALERVSIPYILGLSVWVVFVVFLTVSYS